MAFLDKSGLQHLTNKLVQGDAIKVASHRGHTVKNVIDNITRECENISTPNIMTLENRVSEFRVGKGRDVDVSGDVEECMIGVGLQGRTYQNLISSFNSIQSTTLNEDENSVFNIDGVQIKGGGVVWNVKLIKPNSVYTFIFNIEEVSDLKYFQTDTHEYYITKDVVFCKRHPGIQAIKITTKDTVDDSMRFKLSVSGNSIRNKFKILKNAILLEGDHTQTPIEELPQYFTGIKSSFEDGIVDVEVEGKNLLDLNVRKTNQTGVTHKIIGDSIIVTSDSTSKTYAHAKLYYPTKLFEGKTITFSCKASAHSTSNEPTIQLHYTKTGADKGTWVPFWNRSNTHTFPEKIDGSEVAIQIHTHNSTNTGIQNTVIIEELQAVVCDVKTKYEPYYKKKISFNIGEPLRSLPNGICDEIRNNNGQWELVRRIGKVVFTGETIEGWTRQAELDTENTERYFTSFVKPKLFTPIYCDTIAPGLAGHYDTITSIFAHNSVNRIDLKRLKTDTRWTDVETLRSFLNRNPATVYYELQTPILTPIEPIEFQVKPLATMTINSQISPVSNHTVVLNRAGQIEQGILKIAELRKRVDELETVYENQLIGTQLKLSLLTLDHELEKEEI